METCESLSDYFSQRLSDLRCRDEVRAYIVSIFSQYQFADNDLSGRSITIEYLTARENNDFSRFQRVGDFLFFTNTMYPEYLRDASREYYCSVAQMSYYSCYRLLNRSWKAYEQLADAFVELSHDSRRLIRMT